MGDEAVDEVIREAEASPIGHVGLAQGADRRAGLPESCHPDCHSRPRNKAQPATTCRDIGHRLSRKQVVENAGNAWRRRRELKILVSAVRSRP